MEALSILKEREKEIKKRFGLKKIGIFGSAARGEIEKDSDIDILVDFLEGFETFDNFMELAFYLEDLFVRKVDIITPQGMSKHMLPHIEREVIWIEG